MTRGEMPLLADNASRRNSFAAVRSRLGDNIEIDDLAGGIDGAIQIRPTAGDPHVGLVYPQGSIAVPEFAANALIQNGRVVLDPPPDRDVVNGKPALRHDFSQVSIAEGVSQISRLQQNP
jgi:hypothetical protein